MVDDSLPFILNILLANFFSLVGTAVVLSYAQVNLNCMTYFQHKVQLSCQFQPDLLN